MMATLKSYDPLAYYVNSIVDLDPEVVRAHREQDTGAIKRLLAGGKQQLDVYICVNKHAHAFVLCVLSGEPDAVYPDMFKDDVSYVPDLSLCWRFELCFENQALRTYKLRKVYGTFKDIKGSIQQHFYIGKYTETPLKALEFAALRAAPHRYNALISDCVEFAKEFCIALLSYCGNGIQLEEEVHKRIKEASATGLSVERLSRKVRSSAIIGNSFLGGLDFSNLLGGQRWMMILTILVIVFILFYPILVALVVKKFT